MRHFYGWRVVFAGGTLQFFQSMLLNQAFGAYVAALVQDTGWSAHLPHAEGLLAFSTPEQALAGIDAINGDYAGHARRAREVAAEHFDAQRVLPRLLEETCG